MPRAIDIAHVAYEAPDLTLMERFLTDFGLSRSFATSDELYMRGAGSQHHLHVTRRAATARFAGAAMQMASRDDLALLAALPSSSPVEPSPQPGGGWQVRMTMPDGFEIIALWGRETVAPQRLEAASAFNNAFGKPRVRSTVRASRGPRAAIRLGHFVLHVTDHDASVRWLQQRFGLLASDYFCPPGQDGPVVGTFLRFDAGDALVDHHCMLVLQTDRPGVHHCSFEVQDLDAVMVAHDYLLERGWTLDCGVGRHLMGSQVFDYWKDPFGFRVEHYTDGDVVDATHQPGRFNGTAADTTQWGMEPPADFFQ
jgi:catechol 2,3-dioxygenase-like lactoylglutathione lyase family enzyme